MPLDNIAYILLVVFFPLAFSNHEHFHWKFFSCVFLILVHNIFFYFAIQSLRTEGIATDEKCESKMIRKTSLSGGKLVFLGDDLLFVEYTCARNSPKSVHCAKWLGLALE